MVNCAQPCITFTSSRAQLCVAKESSCAQPYTHGYNHVSGSVWLGVAVCRSVWLCVALCGCACLCQIVCTNWMLCTENGRMRCAVVNAVGAQRPYLLHGCPEKDAGVDALQQKAEVVAENLKGPSPAGTVLPLGLTLGMCISTLTHLKRQHEPARQMFSPGMTIVVPR